ncbi:hypothetical protein FJZ31_29135 [Candidatus Poribacteria bacterium]|nr:hypothetical protein [Candidatus Poribacteria bacterium]
MLAFILDDEVSAIVQQADKIGIKLVRRSLAPEGVCWSPFEVTDPELDLGKRVDVLSALEFFSTLRIVRIRLHFSCQWHIQKSKPHSEF